MNSSSSSTLNSLILSSESATKGSIPAAKTPRVHRRVLAANPRISNAVYAYIRAIRALGRTEVNTVEVASALSLSIGEVNRAISSLKNRGVKTL